MRRLFRQFSFPGGIPSHVAPETPGLDPRGRRARLRAGARLRRRVRQPRPAGGLRRRRRRGRDRARWPRAGTPTSSSTRRRDGAVLPILHLNGYKIANPTRAGPDPATTSCARCCAATATRRTSSRATTRRRCTSRWPATLDRVARRDRRASSAGAASDGDAERPALADDRAASRRRAGPAPRRSTACRSRAPGARTRCRSPSLARRPRAPRACSRSGCAATGRRSSSTTTARLRPELRGAGARAATAG